MILSNSYVIDVGTSFSAPRGKQLQKIYGCPALFVEPDAEALSHIQTGPRDIKVCAAITSFDGSTVFYFYQDGTHSLLETNLEQIHRYIDGYTGKPARKEDWQCRKQIRVDCFTLHSLITRHRIDRVPALKIDTQGHDLEVVKSLGPSLSKVNRIECEVQVTPFEIYKNQSKKEELLSFLREKRYRLIQSEAQTYGQEENLVFQRCWWLDFFYRCFKRFHRFGSWRAAGA